MKRFLLYVPGLLQAESVNGIPLGIGYSSKVIVIDGSGRGRAPATIAVLSQLGILDEAQLSKLGAFARPIVYNRAGRAVGVIRTR